MTQEERDQLRQEIEQHISEYKGEITIVPPSYKQGKNNSVYVSGLDFVEEFEKSYDEEY